MCTLHKKLKKTKPFTELPQPLFVLCHGGLMLSRQKNFHTLVTCGSITIMIVVLKAL